MSLQRLVDTAAADIAPTTARIRSFAFSHPYSVEGTFAAVPDQREAPRFLKLAMLLFSMFNLHLWALIAVIALICVSVLICAWVRY